MNQLEKNVSAYCTIRKSNCQIVTNYQDRNSVLADQSVVQCREVLNTVEYNARVSILDN